MATAQYGALGTLQGMAAYPNVSQTPPTPASASKNTWDQLVRVYKLAFKLQMDAFTISGRLSQEAQPQPASVVKFDDSSADMPSIPWTLFQVLEVIARMLDSVESNLTAVRGELLV